jgi:hypothetical protein
MQLNKGDIVQIVNIKNDWHPALCILAKGEFDKVGRAFVTFN